MRGTEGNILIIIRVIATGHKTTTWQTNTSQIQIQCTPPPTLQGLETRMDCLDRAAQSGVRTEGGVGGGGGARALRDRALHLLRYCAALARPGPRATASEGAGPGR